MHTVVCNICGIMVIEFDKGRKMRNSYILCKDCAGDIVNRSDNFKPSDIDLPDFLKDLF